jgi:CRP-like cAMP-binding protein
MFSVERVIRDILALPAHVDSLVVDFRRVFNAELPALDLWLAFLDRVRGRFGRVFLTGVDHDPALHERLAPAPNGSAAHSCLEETDAALELCEDHLLASFAAPAGSDARVRLEDFDVCEGLDAARIEVLRSVLEFRRYGAGEVIIERHGPPSHLFFLTKGEVSVVTDLPGGGTHRLTTCTPGMLFGEMAILERRPRSADVRADGPVECYVMSAESFERLTATHPDLKVKMLENFAHQLALWVRKLTDEIRALSE